jgi:hypothetical protein
MAAARGFTDDSRSNRSRARKALDHLISRSEEKKSAGCPVHSEAENATSQDPGNPKGVQMSAQIQRNIATKPARYPIFSGGASDESLKIFSSVGRATKPFDDNYYHVRLWMYPRTAFHLVKHETKNGAIHYGLYGRMRTERQGRAVFENPVGEGIILPSSDYIAIQLHFPKERVFLRLMPWEPSIDTNEVSYRPHTRPSDPVNIFSGFRNSIKPQN